MHGIGIAEVGKILRDFDNVAPARTDMVENGFDCGHRTFGLLLDRMRMHMLFVDMWMLVIERRRRGARYEHQIAGTHDVNGRCVGHRMSLFRLWMHGLELISLLVSWHERHTRPPVGWCGRPVWA